MQLTTNENFRPAVAGQIADDGSVKNGDRITVVASEDIPAGALIVQDGTNQIDGRPVAKLPDAGGLGRILGISMYNPMREQRPAVSGVVPPLYKAGDVFTCVRRGRVWANFVGADVADGGETLQVRVTDGAMKGHLTAVAADTANLATGITAYRANVGTLVEADLNLP